MSKRGGPVPKSLTLDCLLETGLLVSVQASSTDTFDDVKRRLWSQASALPLYAVLKEHAQYGFRCVNNEGELIEVDDDQLLGHANMFQPLLKVFQRKGSKMEQKLNMEIGNLISKHLQDFDNMRDPEVTAFRRDIMAVCQEVVTEREKGGMEASALHRYPPIVESAPLPDDLRKKIAQRGYHVKIKINGDHPKEFLMKADIDKTAHELIQAALRKKAGGAAGAADKPENYVLKVLGKEEYLLGGYQLFHYKYIRKCLMRGHEKKDLSDILTVLVLDTKENMFKTVPQMDPEQKRALMKRTAAFDEKYPGIADSLWFGNIAEQKFRVKIMNAHNLVVGRLFGVGVMAGIFLGDEMITKEEKTRFVPPATDPEWGHILEFDIAIKDLPRNSRLCLSIYGVWANPLKVKKTKKNFRNEFPLAWVNVTVFDYRRCLRTGTMQLVTWPYPDTESALFNPLGTTVTNPQRNENSVLFIGFEPYPHDVRFPDHEMIGRKSDGRVDTPTGQTALELTKLQPVVSSDPLHVLTLEEIDLLRKHKFHFKNQPEALSKCLRAVDWSRNEAAHEVADMLRLWAALRPEQALDLLDAGYADESIRSHAVQFLETMSDDKLISYLLQLVQVLKFESYLNCDLARFLLRRALQNQRIGHFFFWYLRSEMHLPEVCTRFGLLLEAYCRGCGPHLEELIKQNNSLRKIERIGDNLKDKNVKDKKQYAIDQLATKELGAFQLPLEPSIRLGQVECKKVFDSAQKPLWLKFHNCDPDGESFNVMYKCGDDLRQDMLTLQLIRIMDQLWQERGLNLQMNAYDCIATGDEVGMLEMVMNSATLWNIQGRVKDVLWNDDTLHDWIKKKNPDPEAYDKACDAFLVSCAGYCVATYVLGIADRHNDNIMMTQSGQLFHIDFGHFLGNWKSKFGVQRERVKFILVPDFVVAMTKGSNQKSERWKQFKEVCRQAYIIVRQNANLFINLLNMMLSTGIPELRSHEDVKYLRETLCLDMSEVEAAEQFMVEIDVALRNSKSVKVNWAFHGAKH
eukprot:m.43448 g.43448  ORF g.43448 m.43448 type:complete len:1025 (+) comp14443_c0_seq1:121-3195(+)